MYQTSALLFEIGYRKNTAVVMLNYEVLFTELRKILEILDKQLTVYYVKKKNIVYIINFTLFSVHGRVCRGLVLRYSVSHFPLKSGNIAC